MNASSSTVAIDVGNTAVKVCVADAPLLEKLHDTSAPYASPQCHIVRIVGASWHLDAADWIRKRLDREQFPCRIASVCDRAADQLHQAIASEIPNASVQRVKHVDVPMAANVDQPERLGIDRLLGAYAAWHRFQRALVVVDIGSAITVDWVTGSGRFGGGAILPGLRLQTQALASGTDALPDIDWQGVESAEPEHSGRYLSISPAANTDDAIRLGVLTGAAAAVDRLAEGYLKAYQSDAVSPLSRPDSSGLVVVTGGDALLLSRHLCLNHEIIPNLVCMGLLEIPRSKIQSTIVS